MMELMRHQAQQQQQQRAANGAGSAGGGASAAAAAGGQIAAVQSQPGSPNPKISTRRIASRLRAKRGQLDFKK